MSRVVLAMAWLAGLAVLVLLLAPPLGLLFGTSPSEVLAALAKPQTQAALWLSLRTTAVCMLIAVVGGTPLAWWLSRQTGRLGGLVAVLVELPVVLPPAVVGVALLLTFGRQGWLGALLEGVGLSLPFSTSAVVLAQLLVGAPLYVLTASATFRAVGDEQLVVAATLGASPLRAWLTVALPSSVSGLLAAAGLAWARALGEFGATLMFAGNLPGRTQTLPLAIYSAMQGDLQVAQAISVLLIVMAIGLLLALRLGGSLER